MSELFSVTKTGLRVGDLWEVLGVHLASGYLLLVFLAVGESYSVKGKWQFVRECEGIC